MSVVASVALGADPAAIATWFWGAIDGLIERIQAGYAINRNSSLAYLSRHAALRGAAIEAVPGSLDVAAVARRLEIVGPIGFKQSIAAGESVDDALRHMSTRMAGVADEAVRNGDRDVIVQSARRGQGVAGWRRRLSGRACGFCAMLASRGAVYVSRRRALLDRSGERYHPHCHCWAEPLYERDRGEPEPPEVQQLQRQWERVTAGGWTPEQQRQLWRNWWENRPPPQWAQQLGVHWRDRPHARMLAGLPERPDFSRLTLAQLRAAVAEHGVTVPAGIRKPALVKLADDLDRGVRPELARQQAVLSITDERRVAADALIRAAELGSSPSDRAMQHVGRALRRDLPEELQSAFRPLLEALDAADIARVQAAMPAVARAAKVKQIGGAVGEVRPFKRGEMEWIGQQRADVVFVIRPGYAATVDGATVTLRRAAVAPATPEQVAALPAKKAAKKAAPAKVAKARPGSTIGDVELGPTQRDIALGDAPPFLHRPPGEFRDRPLTGQSGLLAHRGERLPEGFQSRIEEIRRGRYAQRPGLTPAESAALDQYVLTRVADPLNSGLRAGRTSGFGTAQIAGETVDIDEVMRRLDSAIAASELAADTKLYRGALMRPADLRKLQVGAITREDGFLSTTADSTNAFAIIHWRKGRDGADGRSPVLFEILAPKGTHAAVAGVDELEVLLGRGRRFRVLDISRPTRRGDVRRIVLELLPESAPAKAAAKAAPAKAAKKAAPAKAPAKAPPVPERMSIPALRKELADAGAPDALLAGVPKPALARYVTQLRQTGDPLGAGRLRQEIIDRRKALAEALAEAAQLLDDAASAPVLASRAASQLKRVEELLAGWPQEAPLRSLVTAMKTGNPAAIRRAIASAERRGAIQRIGPTSGDVVKYDRKAMSPLAGERIPDGAQVRVVRPGYEAQIGGERVVLMRPVVEVEEVATGAVGPKAARLPKVADPTDVRAQALAANPNYGGPYRGPITPEIERAGAASYAQNCTRVVIAYELRRRGLDVTAGAGTILGDTTAAYIRTFRQGGRYAARIGEDLSRSMSARQIAAEVETWPRGARGIVTVKGHTLNVERDPVTGRAVFIDAQDTRKKNPVMNLAAFERRMKARGAPTDKWMAVARVDDLDVSDFGLHYVEADGLDIADGRVGKTPFPQDPDSETFSSFEEMAAMDPDDSYP